MPRLPSLGTLRVFSVAARLSAGMLDLSRQWWKARPSRDDAATPVEVRWLFPGKSRDKPMTTRQLTRLFHEAADAAGIRI